MSRLRPAFFHKLAFLVGAVSVCLAALSALTRMLPPPPHPGGPKPLAARTTPCDNGRPDLHWVADSARSADKTRHPPGTRSNCLLETRQHALHVDSLIPFRLPVTIHLPPHRHGGRLLGGGDRPFA